jgi:hypothetical protein
MSQLNGAYFVLKLPKCKDRSMTDFGRTKNYANYIKDAPFCRGLHFPAAEEALGDLCRVTSNSPSRPLSHEEIAVQRAHFPGEPSMA